MKTPLILSLALVAALTACHRDADDTTAADVAVPATTPAETMPEPSTMPAPSTMPMPATSPMPMPASTDMPMPASTAVPSA